MKPGNIEHFIYTNRELQCLKMIRQFIFLDLSNPKPNRNQKSFKTPQFYTKIHQLSGEQLFPPILLTLLCNFTKRTNIIFSTFVDDNKYTMIDDAQFLPVQKMYVHESLSLKLTSVVNIHHHPSLSVNLLTRNAIFFAIDFFRSLGC